MQEGIGIRRVGGEVAGEERGEGGLTVTQSGFFAGWPPPLSQVSIVQPTPHLTLHIIL